MGKNVSPPPPSGGAEPVNLRDALDQAAPLQNWILPESLQHLRRLLEARMGNRGKREFIQVLRLMEVFSEVIVATAALDAIRLGAISFDAVKYLKVNVESGIGRSFWTPIGRYAWKWPGNGVFERLAAYENLPADNALLQAGLLGGTSESAANVVGEIRKFVQTNPYLTW
jgi:hypothetical protein